MNKNKTTRYGSCRQCKNVFYATANRVVFCSLICRLLSETKIHRNTASDCWYWTGHKDKNGYGRLRWKYRELGAHVAMWEAAHEPVPKGKCVLHRCDNPSCVNPTHLWLGSIGDNNADRYAKGRTRFNPRAGDNGRNAKRNVLGRFMCGV